MKRLSIILNPVKRVLLIAVMMMTAMSMSADDIEWTVIEPNVEYTVPSMKNTYWKFTAPMNCIVIINGSDGDFPRPFTDEALQTPFKYNHNYVDGGQRIDFFMEKGQTFYSNTFSLGNDSKFILSINQEDLKMTNVTPAENSVFDIIGSGLLVINFNMSVVYDNATLQCGSHSASITGNINSGGLQFDLKNQIYQWFTDGSIKGGEELTVTVNGVKSAADKEMVYGENGTLTLHFLAPQKPVMKIADTQPAKFLSYWIPGNSDAVLTMEFDGELMTGDAQGAACELSFGSAEADDYYTESLPITIDGKKLSVDFSGKLRTPALMVPSSLNYGQMLVKFINIKAANGTMVFSPEQGQTSSFQYAFNYEELTKDITAEFTPDNGANIFDYDIIKLWISDKTALTYDGVKFEFTVNGELQTIVVSNDQITKEADPVGNGEELTIPVPAAVKNATEVTVSLNEPLYVDGLEHEITCTYSVTNGINDVKADSHNSEIFNLNGNMVEPSVVKTKKGLYIINGKKTVVK